MKKWMAIFLVSALLMLAAEAMSIGGSDGPVSLSADAEEKDIFSVPPFYLDSGEDTDKVMSKRASRAQFWKLLNLYRFHPGASFSYCYWPVSMRPASCFKDGIRPGTPVKM
ncbi:uncharacterized protein LOC144862328 [Branchiostoma floridae x Branchiostoma japonicum]